MSETQSASARPIDVAALNASAEAVLDCVDSSLEEIRVDRHSIAGAAIYDFGIQTDGSLRAGVELAKLCMAGSADVEVTGDSPVRSPALPACGVLVRTDQVVRSCLASQYAGWPLSAGDYFAMASGPMRIVRGREPMLGHIANTIGTPTRVLGVLESDKLPSESAIQAIAEECRVRPEQVAIAIAPSTSLAGTIQVVARCIETAMHQLHEKDFDVWRVLSATGWAPLVTPAADGDTVAGIGRTNDAILYGGQVELWCDATDEQLASVVTGIVSAASNDFGKPFAETFKAYEYDFYKVDPALFAPAKITLHSLRSGAAFSAGEVRPDILQRSLVLSQPAAGDS